MAECALELASGPPGFSVMPLEFPFEAVGRSTYSIKLLLQPELGDACEVISVLLIPLHSACQPSLPTEHLHS